MRPAILSALLALAVLAHPAVAQEFDFTRQGTVWANGPGLECRETTHPTYGYAAPSATSPRLVTFSLVVPVIGPPVNGFLPVALRDGRQAWVRAADTRRNSRYRSCFVRRLRDGRLLYSPHDGIQGD